MGLYVLSGLLSPLILRGPYNQWQKCNEFFELSLSWPDRDFRHEYRMGRTTFDRLVHMLEKNPIFESTGTKPQRPVCFQLACFLLRYGILGANPMQATHKLGIGFGTVFLYCRRVVCALRELGLKVVKWGNEERHQEIARHVMDHSGIPNCIGMLDGTLIHLTQMPERNGFSFMCWKKFPALNVQVIVDHECRFTAVELGWPGSVSDVTMWKKSHIWQQRSHYLRDNALLLADKGYPSSPYILCPFTEPEVNTQPPVERQRRRKFNRRLSSQRITVEHSLGLLKGRFPSLKDMPPEQDIGDTYRAVEALVALHNLCIDLGDHPQLIPFFENSNTEVDNGDIDDVDLCGYGEADDIQAAGTALPAWETDEWPMEAGRQRRNVILDDLFPV